MQLNTPSSFPYSSSPLNFGCISLSHTTKRTQKQDPLEKKQGTVTSKATRNRELYVVKQQSFQNTIKVIRLPMLRSLPRKQPSLLNFNQCLFLIKSKVGPKTRLRTLARLKLEPSSFLTNTLPAVLLSHTSSKIIILSCVEF